MKLVDGPKMRHLKDVSYDELQKAMVDMCKKLGISGSYEGTFLPHYNLYKVVREEKAKVSPDDPMTDFVTQK